MVKPVQGEGQVVVRSWLFIWENDMSGSSRVHHSEVSSGAMKDLTVYRDTQKSTWAH